MASTAAAAGPPAAAAPEPPKSLWGQVKHYTMAFLRWLSHPMNMLEFLLLLTIVASGALLVMCLLRFPFCRDWPQSQVDYWVEVCSQLLNACFTFNALRFFIPRGIQLDRCVKMNKARKAGDWATYDMREAQLLVPYPGVVCSLTPEEAEARKAYHAARRAEEGDVPLENLGKDAADKGASDAGTLDKAPNGALAVPAPGEKAAEAAPASPTGATRRVSLTRSQSLVDLAGQKTHSFEGDPDAKEAAAEYVAALEAPVAVAEAPPAHGPPPYPIPWINMFWILMLLNMNCHFQWPMAAVMWAWAGDYGSRPFWVVALFLVLSFSCMFAGFGWLFYYSWKNNREWKAKQAAHQA
ncbi:hypothetical protein DFJ74DRAFT_379551 [Hyaloraphidium curvatum]|nr:hypothetical protein DFJ74DRAFT_379551 [Hyaloraphidium curvatum]